MARSDNALIALGVERREVSWTQFMRWLFDPVRDVGVASVAARTFLERIGVPVGADLQVLGATAEEVGESGRLDLRLKVQTLGETTIVLVENKVDSSERDNQLADYVAEIGAPPGVRVVSVLLELGKYPARKSSCEGAKCLIREDAEAWLQAVRGGCAKQEMMVPKLVGDYLAVFEAWGLARQLQSEQNAELERGKRDEPYPEAWALVEHWFRDDDEGFFNAVLADPRLRAALENSGLSPTTHGRMRADGGFLQISKPSWTLWPAPGADRGVNVHFECRGRRRIRIDVELYPYLGSVAKDPALHKSLEPQLGLKAGLIRRVRELARGHGGVFRQTARLRSANAVATCTAVVTDGPEFESPQKLASGLVRALEEGIALIEAVLAETRPLMPDQQRSSE